jgi:hypothetical protein
MFAPLDFLRAAVVSRLPLVKEFLDGLVENLSQHEKQDGDIEYIRQYELPAQFHGVTSEARASRKMPVILPC